MTWDWILYHIGYIIALALCRGLGQVFFVPMLLNLAFGLLLKFGAFTGWDIRWVMVGYGFLFFVWVIALVRAVDLSTIVLLVAVDVFAAYRGIQPYLASIGTGGEFWNATSTGILHVWLVSILVVAISAITKSSIGAIIRRRYSELLVIPKRRFLIPIAFWSATILLPDYLGTAVPDFVKQNRFKIAGQLLVWGWVAFELPFYIMYKRMPDDDE